MPGVAVDGNDVFAVWLAMKEASSARGRGKGPTLIEAKTYRTVGHHEGDPVIGTYRTQEELDAWVKRDPVDMFRKRLIEDYGVRRRRYAGRDRCTHRENRAGRPGVRAQIA